MGSSLTSSSSAEPHYDDMTNEGGLELTGDVINTHPANAIKNSTCVLHMWDGADLTGCGQRLIGRLMFGASVMGAPALSLTDPTPHHLHSLIIKNHTQYATEAARLFVSSSFSSQQGHV